MMPLRRFVKWIAKIWFEELESRLRFAKAVASKFEWKSKIENVPFVRRGLESRFCSEVINYGTGVSAFLIFLHELILTKFSEFRESVTDLDR